MEASIASGQTSSDSTAATSTELHLFFAFTGMVQAGALRTLLRDDEQLPDHQGIANQLTSLLVQGHHAVAIALDRVETLTILPSNLITNQSQVMKRLGENWKLAYLQVVLAKVRDTLSAHVVGVVATDKLILALNQLLTNLTRPLEKLLVTHQLTIIIHEWDEAQDTVALTYKTKVKVNQPLS